MSESTVDDTELLRRYAEEKSDTAFGELVQRQIGFVYMCALRRVGGDRHLAEDVAQRVFTALARQAGFLSRHAVLSGWLFVTTRNVSAQIVRTERRRQTREKEIGTMEQFTESSQLDPETLRPLLDTALDSLKQHDREAVLLRFFDGKTFSEIGTKLRLSENSARMRVDRALEKMQALLARKGATSTVAALALALSHQSGLAAPAGLAAHVAGVALGGAGTIGAAWAAISFMSMNTVKVTLVSAAVLAGAGGLALQYRTNAELKSELGELRKQTLNLDSLRSENEKLIRIHSSDTAQLEQAHAEISNIKKAAATAAVTSSSAKTALPGKSAVTLATGLKAASSFSNVGRASPRQTIETIQWATNSGNTSVVAEAISLSPAARDRAAALFATLPQEKQDEYGSVEHFLANLMASTTQVAGMQVMSERVGAVAAGFDAALASDASYHTLHMQTQYVDGRVRENDLVFRQMPNGWQVVLPPSMVGKVAELLKPVPPNLKHDGGG